MKNLNTEVKRQLQEAKERYQTYLKFSSEGIWRIELEKPITISTSIPKQIDHFYSYAFLAECNMSMARMYGFRSPKQLFGARLGDLLHKDNPDNIAYLTAFIKSNYRLVDALSTEKDRFGNTKYFLNNLTGIVENNYLLRAWGTQRDITAQRESEQERVWLLSEVERQRVRLITILDDISGTVWESYGRPDSKEQRVKYVNKYAQKMTGYSVKEWLTTPSFWLKIVHPDDKEKAARIAVELFKQKKSGVNQFRWVTKKGKTMWVEARSSVITDMNGTPIGMRGVTMDITEKMRRERRKDEFISMASHELKTPVTSLKLYTQFLQLQMKKIGDSATETTLSKMDSQIDRLTYLISDLLDLSSIQSGKLKIKHIKFSVMKLVKEVINDLQPTSQHHILLQGSTIAYWSADRNRISQVLINLLNNAIKYSPHADKVIVKIKEEKGQVTISVKDFGMGIAKEYQAKIFDRFYQITSPSLTTPSGLGIGLYISQQIITRHNGKLWVKSQEGKGAIFSFSLPITKVKKKSLKKIIYLNA